jgi:hypothetical protein
MKELHQLGDARRPGMRFDMLYEKEIESGKQSQLRSQPAAALGPERSGSSSGAKFGLRLAPIRDRRFSGAVGTYDPHPFETRHGQGRGAQPDGPGGARVFVRILGLIDK